MKRNFKVSADGFLDVRSWRVRTPGQHDAEVPPAPEDRAVAFLLSHAFPGHRKIVRPLRERDRKTICLAMWSDSVSERMTLVDRVWRGMTEPVGPPPDPGEPHLVQVIAFGKKWAYPIYLDGDVTRVLPEGGAPPGRLKTKSVPSLDLKSA